MKWVTILLLGAGTSLSACASSDVTPIAQDSVLVSTNAAPACGRQGARKVAIAQASIETLKRGYDRFIVVGANASSDVRVVGTTPVYGSSTFTASSYGNSIYGSGSTTMYGGQPIIGGSHEQQFAIKMFRTGDPGFEQAIDARAELGPEWATRIKEKKVTCF
jgi:hypothetical protein